MKTKIILIISLFLILYFGINLCLKFKQEYFYKKGLNKAFELIIKQAKNPNCNTIKIGKNNEEIELINLKCIKSKD